MIVQANPERSIFTLQPESSDEATMLTVIQNCQPGSRLSYAGRGGWDAMGTPRWLDVQPSGGGSELRITASTDESRRALGVIAEMLVSSRTLYYLGTDNGVIQVAGKVCSKCSQPIRHYAEQTCEECRAKCPHTRTGFVMDEVGDSDGPPPAEPRAIPGIMQCWDCGAIVKAPSYVAID